MLVIQVVDFMRLSSSEQVLSKIYTHICTHKSLWVVSWVSLMKTWLKSMGMEETKPSMNSLRYIVLIT